MGADVSSARVWRGITFNSTPVLEPFLTVTTSGQVPILLAVRGTIDVGDAGGQIDAEGFSELQLEATIQLPRGFTASYAELLYPGAHQPRGFPVTREVSLGWLWSGPIEPGLMVHYDVDRVDDYFIEAFVGRTFVLSEKTRLTLEAEGGHAGARFAEAQGAQRGGFHHYDVGARVIYHPSERLGLTLRAAYAGTFHQSLPRQPVGFHATVGVSVGP